MVYDSQLTLREAVERLWAENSARFSHRDMSPEAQEFLRCHDTAHIVFGCDTSIYGEGALKIFTIFGTTLGFWGHISAYADADAFALFRNYSWRHILKDISGLIVSIPRTYLHARQMRRPWPWSDHNAFMDRSIEEIRNEFNIKPVSRP